MSLHRELAEGEPEPGRVELLLRPRAGRAEFLEQRRSRFGRDARSFVRHFDLPVEVHHVSFKDKETQSAEYLAINPMGKVPALVDGDFRLWESNAILTYLATKFAQTKALPADARGRADVDRWLHWQSCHLMPAMGALKVADEKDLSTVTPLLKILDRQLEGREYVLGGLTVVDFASSTDEEAKALLTQLGLPFRES